MVNQRRASRARAAAADDRGDGRGLLPPRLDEVEAVARIGSYALDVATGRWASSAGLDRVFGIDARFDRSVAGWASLIHPADRDGMVAYFLEEVLGRCHAFDRQYRVVRADTREERWVHGRGRLELDTTGRPARMLGTIVDITDQRRAQEALIRSELRYATIFEGTTQAILIAERESLRLRFVNGAAATLFGYDRDELLGLTARDIHPPDALPAILDRLAAVAGGSAVGRSVPCLRKDGSVWLADIRASAAEIDGLPCIVGFYSDVTELRRIEAQERRLAAALEQTSDAILVTDAAARIEYVNAAFERLSGLARETVIGGDSRLLGSIRSPDGFDAVRRGLEAGGSWAGDIVHRDSDGAEGTLSASITPLYASDGAAAGHVTVGRDVTAARALQAERARLVAAVEQTSDSVIITDAAGTIEYVNPAFERVSGYGREEAVGQNPRILKSGRQPAAFYAALWRRLTRGRSWMGVLINRRKDGGLYEEEATISPIRDGGGTISGYIAVKRDVTAVRAAESELERHFRERAQVSAALGRLEPRPSVAETAADICAELVGVPGVDAAALLHFPEPGQAATLAVVGPVDLPLAPGRPVPRARARYLFERATLGPWAETWRERAEDGRYGATIAALGIKAVAYAPIRNGQGLLGLVAAGTCDEAFAGHLIEHLPAVGEFAASAGTLIGDRLEREHRSDRTRKRIGRILARRSYRPVFQPIRTLDAGAVVGYEALTRFGDATAPDLVFAQAHAVDLGVDLELACLEAALDAADALPSDRWLSVNISPVVILADTRLRPILADRARPIVLEVTEHVEIVDYASVRRALGGLGPSVRLAVDDAGAGFASLRHVIELQPGFLKVDVSLVRDVDRDPVRQAMVAGLVHFSHRSGCTVIAEGIETEAERDMLRELGIPLGQGNLLGRPQALPAT